MLTSKLNASSPTEAIYERIWSAIAERNLRPGTRLKEEQLAEIFAVSRARVRSALAALERDGLVKLVPNRGAFVAEPTIEEARDVFFARSTIEGRLVERLCANAGTEAIDRLKAYVAEERAAAERRDRAAAIRLSGGFHLLIAELAGSPYLFEVLRDLVSRTSLITAMYQPQSEQDCGPDEHEEIVAMIGRGDAEAAKRAMDHHLNHIEHQLNLEQSDERPRQLREILSR
ncbi:GntR family transcriptional regulator [Chelativorans sp. M5D2P16]|uniref:GntR family transcriptional regulator n=1 Tax=Chelativorans sp. M5D2P16 TaxID=3095678 RepID=UPI002ACA4774|nr:GntR family transcriptional regulator [Chelativorans sp. M5D2P16]MDZ5698027.1 GntR family transcriptional regulator [Chelativorans sp. M5D2P16]